MLWIGYTANQNVDVAAFDTIENGIIESLEGIIVKTLGIGNHWCHLWWHEENSEDLVSKKLFAELFTSTRIVNYVRKETRVTLKHDSQWMQGLMSALDVVEVQPQVLPAFPGVLRYRFFDVINASKTYIRWGPRRETHAPTRFLMSRPVKTCGRTYRNLATLPDVHRTIVGQ